MEINLSRPKDDEAQGILTLDYNRNITYCKNSKFWIEVLSHAMASLEISVYVLCKRIAFKLHGKLL